MGRDQNPILALRIYINCGCHGSNYYAGWLKSNTLPGRIKAHKTPCKREV